MHIFEKGNSMSPQDWAELIHRVRVKRFQEAAELLLKARREKANAKVVKIVALRMKTEWESVREIRRESGYSTKELAQEVIENIEDWLESAS